MTYSQLLEVIAVSCLLTLALVLLLGAVQRRLKSWTVRYLPPRYLKPQGVRRRESAVGMESKPHEPS